MPKRQPLIAQLREQAANVLRALEEQIALREADLEELSAQLATWRGLVGGTASPSTRSPRRAATPKSGRVNWDDILASLPNRFGVEDVLKHPDAARRGRAQVYPAFTRWELAKRIRRVGKGIYEKAGKSAEPQAARRKAKKERARAKKRAA